MALPSATVQLKVNTFDSFAVVLTRLMLHFRLVCVSVGVHYHIQSIHECSKDKEYREVWNVSIHIHSHMNKIKTMFTKCKPLAMFKYELDTYIWMRERERERRERERGCNTYTCMLYFVL